MAGQQIPNTSIEYLQNVSSDVQSQINSKVGGPNSSNMGDAATFTDGSGKYLSDSGVSLNLVKGISSIIAYAGGGVFTTATIPFGKTFTSAPKVIASKVDNSWPGTNAYGYYTNTWWIQSISTTGFTVIISTATPGTNGGSGYSGNCQFTWLAWL
jgi:hypothetical protein